MLKWAGILVQLKLRITAALLMVFPFPTYLIYFISCLFCVFVIIRNRKQWPNVAWFARQIKYPKPAWRFLLRYYQETYFQNLFLELLVEIPEKLEKYIDTDQVKKIKQENDRQNGLILIGSHYGPPWMLSFLLSRQNIIARPYISKENRELIRHSGSLRPSSLRNKLAAFIESRDCICQGSESELLKFLQKGGIVPFHNDMPVGNDKSGMELPFLGIYQRFALFPFKVAAKYKIPILYFSYVKNKHHTYKLTIDDFSVYSSPESGLRKYVESINHDILKNPFPWYSLIEFKDWNEGYET